MRFFPAIIALIPLLARPAASATGRVETSSGVMVLRAGEGEASSAVFSPDGSLILGAFDSGRLVLFSAATGKTAATWDGRAGEANWAVFSPDGKTVLACFENKSVKLFETASGRPLGTLEGHKDEPIRGAFSPDGKSAATVSLDGELLLWDVLARRLSGALSSGETPEALAAVFSPDGRRLLAGQWDQTLRFYDLPGGKLSATLTGHARPVLAVSFSPDGKKIASGGRDETVRLWDADGGSRTLVLRGHSGYVHSVAFSPGGRRVLSGGADYTVRLWDASDGSPLAVLRGHAGIVQRVAFSPDGKSAVSAGEDRTIRVWDLTRLPPPKTTAAGVNAQAASAKAALGRRLFFDRRLSGDGTSNCASCHIPHKDYADGRALSIGYPDTLYFRNTPSLVNASKKKLLYWDGRFPGDDLPSLIRDHLAEAHFMNADGRLVVEKLRQAPGYVEAFRKVYGQEPSYAKLLDALAAFLRTLESGESPYDRFAKGDADALSHAARRGRDLFFGKGGCADCHVPPLFADGKLHARKVPENPEVLREPLRAISFRRFFKLQGIEGYASVKEDLGLYAVTKDPRDKGKFKTPSLREAARTAPYMHNGMLKSLEEAVALEGPKLDKKERADVVEFLKALSSALPIAEPPVLPEYALLEAAGPAGASANSGRTGDSSRTPGKRQKGSGGLEMNRLAVPADEVFPPLGPLPPVPAPPDNPITPAKVKLGELLFFDPRTSGDGDTSCADCHEPKMGWGDGSAVARGYSDSMHWRNSQTLLNAAYFPKFNWDGSKSSLEEQARAAIVTNISGNGDPDMIEERLAQSPEYVKLFKAAFGVDRPTFEAVLKAIASYERAVPLSKDVPFDRFMKGDRNALGPDAKRGMELFSGKAGCIRCHNGPLASDQKFYATGVPVKPVFFEDPLRQVTVRYKHVLHGVPEEAYREAFGDPGLYLVTLKDEDRGKFRTPSLRELTHTAPYMHNGAFENLRQVVEFYDAGAGESPAKSPLLKPLGLTDAEKSDLTAFLKSLSGKPVVVPYPDQPPYAPGRKRR